MSSRVLFRTEKEQKVFEENGVEEYLKYQVEHENEPLDPGPAFPFVKVTDKDTVAVYCTADPIKTQLSHINYSYAIYT